MKQTAKVIAFPTPKRGSRRRPPARRVDGPKHFTPEQVRLIRKTARDAAERADDKGQTTAIRAWMIVNLLLNSGLREAEAAGLKCGHLHIGYGEAEIFVATGKGQRCRHVAIPQELKTHLRRYLRWKEQRGESVHDDAPLLLGQRGALSPSGVAEVVKGVLRRCGLYRPGMSAHSLRHTFAVGVYRKSRDIIVVQKLLGHADVSTTRVYADIADHDLRAALDGGLW